MEEILTGRIYKTTRVVTEKDTAHTIGSGRLAVLATPVLIAGLEQTCADMVQAFLEEGQSTVGTAVNIRHLAATPVGMHYSCEAEITAIEGRKLQFRVRAFDERECIAEGTHERFIITEQRFIEKANGKFSPRFSVEEKAQLLQKLKQAAAFAEGSKALEYGSGRFSLAEELRDYFGDLACTDPAGTVPETGISTIPNAELGEDCYFGRFQLLYTLFNFGRMRPFVDELMRLRRLIIKGGKFMIVDFDFNGHEADCARQLERCGFKVLLREQWACGAIPVFLILAEK